MIPLFCSLCICSIWCCVGQRLQSLNDSSLFFFCPLFSEVTTLDTYYYFISVIVHSFIHSTPPYNSLKPIQFMAQQEEGWPLGLRLLNGRIGLVRESDFSGSISFTTMLTGTASPTHSTDSSSDLDTQSTGSFFRDKSITLGSLLGISTFLELSRRSTRGRELEPSKDNKKNHKLKPWLFSLCSRLTTDAVSTNIDAPSLGQYLVAERRAASTYRRNQCNGLSPVQESNSPFVGGQVALSSPASLGGDSGGRELNRALEQNNGYGTPELFSRLCG